MFLEQHTLERRTQGPDNYVQRHTARVRGAAGPAQVGSLGSMRREDSYRLSSSITKDRSSRYWVT